MFLCAANVFTLKLGHSVPPSIVKYVIYNLIIKIWCDYLNIDVGSDRKQGINNDGLMDSV